jgi:hypothetical protein
VKIGSLEGAAQTMTLLLAWTISERYIRGGLGNALLTNLLMLIKLSRYRARIWMLISREVELPWSTVEDIYWPYRRAYSTYSSGVCGLYCTAIISGLVYVSRYGFLLCFETSL